MAKAKTNKKTKSGRRQTKRRRGVPSRGPRGRVAARPDSILALRGLGREIWADEDADDYVRRLREDY